jgi:ribose 5-phosphate isomerase B
MRIAIASDHAAVEHKRAIAEHLRGLGHEVDDFGTDATASCDYPDFVGPACRAVSDGRDERAVVLCGSGIGASIVANKFPGLRCGLAYNLETARLAREHNNAQVLALGARYCDAAAAIAMVDAWLNASFEPRHQRRLDKIDALTRSLQSGKESTAC